MSVLKVDFVMGSEEDSLTGSVFMKVDSDVDGVKKGSLLLLHNQGLVGSNEVVLMRGKNPEDDIEIRIGEEVSLYKGANGSLFLEDVKSLASHCGVNSKQKFLVTKVAECSAEDIFKYKEDERTYIVKKGALSWGEDEKKGKDIVGELEVGKYYEVEIGPLSWGTWWHFVRGHIEGRVPCREEDVVRKSLILRVDDRKDNTCACVFVGFRFATNLPKKYFFFSNDGLNYFPNNISQKRVEYLGAFIPKNWDSHVILSMKEFNKEYQLEAGEENIKNIPILGDPDGKTPADIYKVRVSDLDACDYLVNIKSKFALSGYSVKAISDCFVLVRFDGEDFLRGAIEGASITMKDGNILDFICLNPGVRIVTNADFIIKGTEGASNPIRFAGVSLFERGLSEQTYTV